ncbi:MAG: RHS repeat-associated core domain-containing protein, partial [Candidatus Firestonebacteria bacterium]
VHGVEMISKRDISGIMYYLYDAIGNTMATIDGSGNIVVRYEYDAFGKVRSETPSGDTRNKNKFVGGHGIVDDSDDDGLIYMRARYYDSETGRFISRDPVAGEFDIPLTLNKYVYCLNNPISYYDKDGETILIQLLIRVRQIISVFNWSYKITKYIDEKIKEHKEAEKLNKELDRMIEETKKMNKQLDEMEKEMKEMIKELEQRKKNEAEKMNKESKDRKDCNKNKK